MAGIYVLDGYYLAITALISLGYQLLGFAIAYTLKFDKITDLFGGTNFVLIAAFTLGASGATQVRNIVASVLVMLWGIRLSGFLLFRIIKTGTDTRFDDKRENFVKFLGFWLIQVVWAWTVSLPVTIGNSPSICDAYVNPNFGTAADIVGIVMFAIGFLLEAVADIQKYTFRQAHQDKSKFMQHGTWKWSRHPNYFGEILLWFGIFTLLISPAQSDVLPSDARAALFASVLGPIFLTLLLFFVSGIPLQDRPAAKRRYDNGNRYEAFVEYQNRTSIFFPLPPRIYGRLPTFIKRSLFLDFPMYVFRPVHSRESAEP